MTSSCKWPITLGSLCSTFLHVLVYNLNFLRFFLFQKPSQEEVEKFKEYILETFDDNSDGKISMSEVRTIFSILGKALSVVLVYWKRDGFLSYSSYLIYPLRALWHISIHRPLSRLAATVFTCSYNCHPASALSFSTVRPPGCFWPSS